MANICSSDLSCKPLLLNNSFDLTRMEKELTSLIKQEERYRRENDAKFRAVAQNVPTYKDFEDIVKACHLKPLEKQDKTELKAKKIWNTMGTNSDLRFAHRRESRSRCLVGCHSSEEEQMKLERAFWSMVSAKERYRYLKSLEKEMLLNFVSSDLCSSCVGLLFASLVEMEENDFQLVVDLLEQLTKAAHFNSSLSLLNDKDKAVCRYVFQMLETMKDADNCIAKVGSLKEVFRAAL